LPEEVIAQGLMQRENASYEIAKDCSRQASGDFIAYAFF
jgi:hypothetical protein